MVIDESSSVDDFRTFREGKEVPGVVRLAGVSGESTITVHHSLETLDRVRPIRSSLSVSRLGRDLIAKGAGHVR